MAAHFIGRAAELDVLRRSFEDGARLVTVLGPGGMGKTCLARQFARSQPRPRSLFFDVSSAVSQDDLFATIADGLGVRLPLQAGASDVARHLTAAVRAMGPSLILLDNFEHLVRFAASTVGAWLAGAPEAQILATSREPLGLGEEVRLLLGPWSLEEGVAFFTARARSLSAGTKLVEEDRAIVEQIVRRVDGMPLALELASARLPILSPAEILARLGHRFQLLRGRRRDVTPRHATLQAAIDWSWDLLAPDERLAFAQCSVFSMSFSMAAAEAVLALERESPLDALHSLIEKSLVLRSSSPGEPARFSMFESLREYAAAKLASSPAHHGALARHASYFAAFADARAASAWGQQASASIDALGRELPNLIEVIRRDDAHVDEAARIVIALEPLLYTRGPFGRSMAILDQVARGVDRVKDPLLAAGALIVRAAIQRVAGHVADAEEDLRRATDLVGARDAAAVHARIAHLRGNLARDQLRVWDAREHFTAAIDRAREAGDARTLAQALSDRAAVRYDTPEEDPGAAEALALAVAAGDLRMIATVSVNRAIMRWIFGAPATARAHAEAALSTLREVGDHELEGVARIVLGTSLACLGDVERAEIELRAAGRIARTLGRHFFLPMAFSFLGILLLWRSGRRSDARDAFDEALALDGGAGARALARVGLGILAAEEGDVQQAEQELAHAQSALMEYPEPNLPLAIEVLEGILDLARARVRASRGELSTAKELRASASRRIQGWFEPWEGPDHPVKLGGELRLGALGALLVGPILVRALAEVEGWGAEIPRDEERPTRRREAMSPGQQTRSDELVIGPAQRWFRVGAEVTVDLSTRQVFRRILRALVEHHRSGREPPVSSEKLIAATWPGERIDRGSARNRLNNAIATLRSLGLRGLLVTEPRGYRISPGTNVVEDLGDAAP